MSRAIFYLGSVARRLGVNSNYLFDAQTALQRGEPLRLSDQGDEGTGTAQAAGAPGEAVTVTRAQVDALGVAEAHRLCRAIWGAANSDEAVTCFLPITDMVERSILARPSADVQTLAAKVWATSFPFSEADPAQVAMRDDIEAILAQDFEGTGTAQAAGAPGEAVTVTRAQVDALGVAEARALFLALWYSTDSDEATDVIDGLADLLKRSILTRPADDVQTFAAKAWAVLLPI
ncbi:MAG: hypothetical protein ACEPO2_13585, partial [Pelagibaca sp.]